MIGIPNRPILILQHGLKWKHLATFSTINRSLKPASDHAFLNIGSYFLFNCSIAFERDRACFVSRGLTARMRSNSFLSPQTHSVISSFRNKAAGSVKTEAVNGEWKQEYKNLKMGKQPDSLFEIPTGYKKS